MLNRFQAGILFLVWVLIVLSSRRLFSSPASCALGECAGGNPWEFDTRYSALVCL